MRLQANTHRSPSACCLGSCREQRLFNQMPQMLWVFFPPCLFFCFFSLVLFFWGKTNERTIKTNHIILASKRSDDGLSNPSPACALFNCLHSCKFTNGQICFEALIGSKYRIDNERQQSTSPTVTYTLQTTLTHDRLLTKIHLHSLHWYFC